MAIRKNPKIDLKLKYRKLMELSLILALIICIVLFQAFKRFEGRETQKKFEAAKIGPFPIPTSFLDELTIWMDEALSSQVLPGGKEIFFETINISNGQLFINGYAK